MERTAGANYSAADAPRDIPQNPYENRPLILVGESGGQGRNFMVSAQTYLPERTRRSNCTCFIGSDDRRLPQNHDRLRIERADGSGYPPLPTKGLLSKKENPTKSVDLAGSSGLRCPSYLREKKRAIFYRNTNYEPSMFFRLMVDF